ncbi:unnamed protein product [Auanema sp. JU1783]|nr:unnamed protein product [Auanema sp. JU1783]
MKPSVSARSLQSSDKQDGSSEKTSLMRSRNRHRLRLSSAALHHSNHYIAEPSPVTPCTVFSFDLPNSPAVLSGRPRFSRSPHLPNTAGVPLSPRSIFSFDLETPFHFGSTRTLRTPTTPRSPITPCPKTAPGFPGLPTIVERQSFSFAGSIKDDNGSVDNGQVNIIDTEPGERTDWSSIRLIMFVILFTRIQFTVYFASLYPFLRVVDPESTSNDYALITAAYSIGIAGSAPIFGYVSNKFGCIRKPSMFSMMLMFLTNTMYIFLYNVNPYGKVAMGVARFLAGIAAGGNALLPTYWTYAAAPEDRSMAAALFDGAFCLGIAIGPGFQLLFSLISQDYLLFGFIHINMYTLPAIVANVLVASAYFLMAFKFQEVPMAKDDGKRHSVDSTGSASLLPPYDKLAVILCIFGKMVQMFIYASMETIGSMYTESMFDLTTTQTTQYNSMLVSLSGLVGFLFLISYVWTKIGKRIDNRHGVLIGVSVCVAFVACTYPWFFFKEGLSESSCKYRWCGKTHQVPQILYTVAYVLVFGIGFALMNVHLAATYSSVLGPRRQGTMHGINTLLASCSRVLGPIAVTDMFVLFGPNVVWIFQLATWGLLIIPLIIFYNRLVPCKLADPGLTEDTIEEALEEHKPS